MRIDGRLVYEDECSEGGFDDFVYPATDVYLVDRSGAAPGGKLTDASGVPNTIVATTSLFIEEVIAVTSPGGSLREGAYDVVYDTCQDGTYDPPLDTLFPSAVVVELPVVLPDASGVIAELKVEARTEFLRWVAISAAMKALFELAAKAMEVQCGTSPLACALEELDFFGTVEERFLNLLLSQANHYLAIAQDPPDATSSG